MKVEYFSLWENCIAGILSKINFMNGDQNTPGVRHELVQILRQPTDLDTPGGHITEGWIGIVKMMSPPQGLSKPDYLRDDGFHMPRSRSSQIAKGEIQVDLDQQDY